MKSKHDKNGALNNFEKICGFLDNRPYLPTSHSVSATWLISKILRQKVGLSWKPVTCICFMQEAHTGRFLPTGLSVLNYGSHQNPINWEFLLTKKINK